MMHGAPRVAGQWRQEPSTRLIYSHAWLRALQGHPGWFLQTQS